METYPSETLIVKYASSGAELKFKEYQHDQADIAIPEGKRNVTLASLAGTMRRRGMTADEIEAALFVINRNRCMPPLPDNEIRSIARSIAKYPPSISAEIDQYDKPDSGLFVLKQGDLSRNQSNHKDLPEVILFRDGTGVTITDTCTHLGKIYSDKSKIFRRVSGHSNDKTQQLQIVDNDKNLKILSPECACSEFETEAQIITIKKNEKVHAVLKETDAKRILASPSFFSQLPPLRMVTRCPVIVQSANGQLKILNHYDRGSGIFASGTMPKDLNVDDAVSTILSSVDEFSFKSAADKSRALASIITPALIMGGIGNFRSPIQFIEADQSQTGKGFLTRIITSFYNDIPHVINQQHGGLGSLEESLSQALVDGKIFINLDNLTSSRGGVFNSEKLCSLMTEDMFFARCLRTGFFVDPKLHIIQLTTNGCSLSKDLMNRSCPIAIQKRCGFKYRQYPEGSILDHIRTNQPKFLGAVFSIIREWCHKGKAKTDTMTHDSSFTPWAQSLDWIVQNIMHQAPLLDGYKQVRDRITSPQLQKIRDIALVILQCPRKDDWLTSSDILEIVGPEGIEFPGLDSGYDYYNLTEEQKDVAKQQLGASFKRLFDQYGNNNILMIDRIKIHREERKKTYDYSVNKIIKYYLFTYYS